ncbi:MAG TPA: cupredoxin family copper-binding protein [Pseudonocardiaceae bacterium]
MGLHIRRSGALFAPMAVAAVIGIAACGTTTATTTPPPATSMPASMSMPATTSAAATAPVATNTVAIKGFAFTPANITVKVGTTVTWTNQDQDAHTVTATGGAFGSQALNTGSHYTFTFTKPGSYDYLCTIHPFMTATVVVTP